MSLKQQLSTAITLLSLVSVVSAAPAIALGDDVALFFTPAVVVEVDDNVFRGNGDEESDIRYAFIPGVEIDFGAPGGLSGTIDASYEFTRYLDVDGLDGEFFDVGLRSSYVSGPAVLGFRARYDESFSTDEDTAVGDTLIEQETLTGNVNGRYQFSDVLAGSLSFDYTDREYDRDDFATSESVGIQGRGFFAITPRTELTAGARFRTTDVEIEGAGDQTYDDVAFSVGVAGELFSPLWTGDLSIGWQEREFDDGETDDSIFYTGLVTFRPTTTQIYTFRVSRDYSTSALGGESFARGTGTLNATYLISPRLSINGSIGYTETNYDNSARDNSNTDLSAGVRYSPNEFINLSVTARALSVEADGPLGSEYDQALFTMRASFRY